MLVPPRGTARRHSALLGRGSAVPYKNKLTIAPRVQRRGVRGAQLSVEVECTSAAHLTYIALLLGMAHMSHASLWAAL